MTPEVKHGAKVGIHALQASSFAAVQTAVSRGITWPVVKSVGDVAWLSRVKEISPDTITVARVAHNLDGIGEGLTNVENVQNGDYSQYVELLFRPILRELSFNPHLKNDVDYWEICNEPDPPEALGYQRMAECMIACMDKAEEIGIRLGIFALNAGTPEWDEIHAMMQTDVFRRCEAGGHIICVHEGVFIDAERQEWGEVDQWYGGAIPTEQRFQHTGPYIQLREAADGTRYFDNLDKPQELSKDSYTAGPLNFRYRFWLQVLRNAGRKIPFLVSEIRLGATSHYAARLPWYDERAAQDPELLAYLPFTWSPYNSSHWGDADMGAATNVVLDYMESVKNRPNAVYDEPIPPPPVVVEPMPTLHEDFEDFKAHPSRVAVPSGSLLRRMIEADDLQVASSELRRDIQGVDSMAILASNKEYMQYALYYVKHGDWREEAVKTYDPHNLKKA